MKYLGGYFLTASRLYIFAVYFCFSEHLSALPFIFFCTSSRRDPQRPISSQLCTPIFVLTTHLFHWERLRTCTASFLALLHLPILHEHLFACSSFACFKVVFPNNTALLIYSLKTNVCCSTSPSVFVKPLVWLALHSQVHVTYFTIPWSRLALRLIKGRCAGKVLMITYSFSKDV